MGARAHVSIHEEGADDGRHLQRTLGVHPWPPTDALSDSKGSVTPHRGPLRMQHDDNRTGRRIVRINRTQRSLRTQDHPTERYADEVSRCVISPERKAIRQTLNTDFEPTAESLIGLLPDAEIPGVKVDDVCRRTLFLANLIGSPYVRIN